MLPDFPALKAEIQKIILTALRQRIATGDPVFAKVKVLRQREGRQMRYEQHGGGTVQEGFEEFGTHFQVRVAGVPDLVGAKLDAKIEEISQAIISQSARAFYRKMDESCEKAGTAIDAGGKPFSPQIFLEAINTVEMEFGPDGKPTQCFIIHPDMLPLIQKVMEQIDNDPELKRRHAEILERQREAWAARESNRKLVD